MASVQLRSCLISPENDLADVIALRVNAWGSTPEADVVVEQFTAGRLRAIRRPGRRRTVRLSAPHVDRETWSRLGDLVGEVVLFRDTRGLRMWGVYASLDGDEFRPSNSLQTVTAQITEVTVSEVV